MSQKGMSAGSVSPREGAKGGSCPTPTFPGLDPEIRANPMRSVNTQWGWETIRVKIESNFWGYWKSSYKRDDRLMTNKSGNGICMHERDSKRKIYVMLFTGALPLDPAVGLPSPRPLNFAHRQPLTPGDVTGAPTLVYTRNLLSSSSFYILISFHAIFSIISFLCSWLILF